MKTLANCPEPATPTPCLRRWRLPVRCTQTGGRQAALPRSAELATKPSVGEGKVGGDFRTRSEAITLHEECVFQGAVVIAPADARRLESMAEIQRLGGDIGRSHL